MALAKAESRGRQPHEDKNQGAGSEKSLVKLGGGNPKGTWKAATTRSLGGGLRRGAGRTGEEPRPLTTETSTRFEQVLTARTAHGAHMPRKRLLSAASPALPWLPSPILQL